MSWQIDGDNCLNSIPCWQGFTEVKPIAASRDQVNIDLGATAYRYDLTHCPFGEDLSTRVILEIEGIVLGHPLQHIVTRFD